jgi:hypothetical protein
LTSNLLGEMFFYVLLKTKKAIKYSKTERMKNWKMSLAAVALMGMSVMSCEKELLELLDFSNAETELQLTNSNQSVDDEVDAVSFNSKGIKASFLQDRLPAGATIIDSGEDTYPRTLQLNFGEGTEDRKRCKKQGEIIVEMTDDMATVGAQRITTFNDFFVKGRKITGTKTMTTLSINADGQPVFKVEANLEMLNKKGMAATRVMTGTKTWKSGFGDEDRFNDVFAVEGTATLQRENDLMTRTITSPLIIDRSCDFIKKGIIDLDKNGTITTLDFGDGTCDAIATVTKDGDTYEIDLEEERVNRGKGKCNKGNDTDVAQDDN